MARQAKKTKKPAKKMAAKKKVAKKTLKMKAKAKPKAKAKTKAKKARGTMLKAKTKSAPTATLQVGQLAPAFTLPTDDGRTVSLSDFAGRTVVLYFYPKDDTPGCTQESCDFRDSMAQFNRVSSVILGVSKDSVESHQKFKTKFGLTFPLLADTTGQTCEAYGVWKEKSMYGKSFMGIERTTFIIGPDSRIRKIYPKVSVTGHVQEILRELGATTSPTTSASAAF